MVVDAGESGVVASPVEPDDAGYLMRCERISSDDASSMNRVAGGGCVVEVCKGQDCTCAIVGGGRLNVESNFRANNLPGASE